MNLTSQGSACGDRGPCLASVTLHTLFDVGTLTGLTDGQLLDRFRMAGIRPPRRHSHLSVDRHGSMVLKVCRDVLGDLHDARTLLQATFLVLARRAGSIRRGEAVAGWLYEVAP